MVQPHPGNSFGNLFGVWICDLTGRKVGACEARVGVGRPKGMNGHCSSDPTNRPFHHPGSTVPTRPRAQTGLKKKCNSLQKPKSFKNSHHFGLVASLAVLRVERACHPHSTVGAASWRCLPQSEPLPVTFVPFFQVYGLLDNMVTDLMVLADELNPRRDLEQPLRPCT